MSLVNIKIEGQPYQVEAGLTILEAAKFLHFVHSIMASATRVHAVFAW